jgi:hypothetical protein
MDYTSMLSGYCRLSVNDLGSQSIAQPPQQLRPVDGLGWKIVENVVEMGWTPPKGSTT